jgi:hypothetical protein
VLETVADGGKRMMIAAGERGHFASGYGQVAIAADETATLDRAAADLIGIAPGDRFLAIGR